MIKISSKFKNFNLFREDLLLKTDSIIQGFYITIRNQAVIEISDSTFERGVAREAAGIYIESIRKVE
jgi:hypothetical protein